MSTPTAPVTLYRHALSGHAHRAQLLLSLLNVPHTLVDVDLKAGAQKRPEFLELNPVGQVPVLVDGDVVVADSNAILVYLATKYDAARTWLPTDAVQAAQVQRWLSVAAGEIANGPAAARLITVFGAKLDADRAQSIAARLFAVLEPHLATSAFLAGEAPTIADLAGYGYIANAPEGNVSLEAFPNIRAWLARIEALPGFVPFQQTPAGLRAQ